MLREAVRPGIAPPTRTSWQARSSSRADIAGTPKGPRVILAAVALGDRGGLSCTASPADRCCTKGESSRIGLRRHFFFDGGKGTGAHRRRRRARTGRGRLMQVCATRCGTDGPGRAPAHRDHISQPWRSRCARPWPVRHRTRRRRARDRTARHGPAVANTAAPAGAPGAVGLGWQWIRWWCC